MAETVEDRVVALEQWKNTITLELLRADFQHKFLVEQFNRIDQRFDRYDGHFNKAIALVVFAIITAFMTFVLKGGLQ